MVWRGSGHSVVMFNILEEQIGTRSAMGGAFDGERRGLLRRGQGGKTSQG